MISYDVVSERWFGIGLFNLLEELIKDVEGLNQFHLLDGCKVMVSFFINFGA